MDTQLIVSKTLFIFTEVEIIRKYSKISSNILLRVRSGQRWVIKERHREDMIIPQMFIGIV